MRTLLLLSLTIGFGCAAIEPEEVEESRVVAAVIAACPTGEWCVESAADPAAPLLHSVFAINANDVFAVGDEGTILRRTNSEWRAMASGTTVNLRGVWGASSTDVWAVGVEGTVLHFDGTAWSTVPAPDSFPLDAVWGSGRGDVWMAGSSRVLRWNGAGFTTFDLGGTLLSVHGTSPTDVWVTGEQANLRRFNGISWSTVTSSFGPTYFAVHALSTTDVWTTPLVLGKETARLVSGKWLVKTTQGFIFQTLSARAANDIWAAGGNDRIGHWNGTLWTTDQPFGPGAMLWSITTTTGHAWVVGNGSLIAHRAL